MTDEQRAKISLAQMGKHPSEETRAKMSVAKIGKVLTYKTKTCSVCGKEYQPNSNHQKYCVECMADAKQAKTVKWHAANLPRDAKRRRESYAVNLERERAKRNAQRKKNPHYAQTMRDYRKANPEKIRAISHKHEAKRRALGFHLLNLPFPGCEGHHMNYDDVIHIPVELHKSVPHNIWTGRNMAEINALAQQWAQTMEAYDGHD